MDGIVEAIRESRALKIYVCNVMTQEGETEGYTASDHIRALFNHSCPGLFDLCLVNDAPIPPSVMRGYTREGAEPILCDRDACEALGVADVRPVRYRLVCERCGQEFCRSRRSPLVDHPERYRCRCGGVLRRSN